MKRSRSGPFLVFLEQLMETDSIAVAEPRHGLDIVANSIKSLTVSLRFIIEAVIIASYFSTSLSIFSYLAYSLEEFDRARCFPSSSHNFLSVISGVDRSGTCSNEESGLDASICIALCIIL